MKKRVIQTDKAPKAIGPYSQAIQVGNLLFLSGQIPLDLFSSPPARSTVEVAKLPRNAEIEIEAIALARDMDK